MLLAIFFLTGCSVTRVYAEGVQKGWLAHQNVPLVLHFLSLQIGNSWIFSAANARKKYALSLSDGISHVVVFLLLFFFLKQSRAGMAANPDTNATASTLYPPQMCLFLKRAWQRSEDTASRTVAWCDEQLYISCTQTDRLYTADDCHEQLNLHTLQGPDSSMCWWSGLGINQWVHRPKMINISCSD